MTIDSIFFAETDRLAQAEKAFIPAKIPVSHWQLRHYISSPEKDTLYYASGNEVYYLDTATKKRKHLATLPFEARCTASGHGYVCVGGENEGHFAVIKLEASRANRHVHVDAPLPIDEYWQAPATAPRAVNVRIERIGEEIVNSISIHQVKDEEAHLYDIVAVLTNNDRTVRVYSLQQGLETACLDLPFPMNHASISPDGQSLVAVGDSNQAFFYNRLVQDTPPQIPKPHNRLNTSSATWIMACRVYLRSEPKPHDSVSHPGYFTTAWSPSGHLVAVGSEGGHISLFDTQLLQQCAYEDGEDAIVATIPSTRPEILAIPSARPGVVAHVHPGAVRTIIFSPEPWDLLIWAEDQGRICIGDLRTALRTKQVIHLQPDDQGLDKIEPQDLPDDLELDDALLRHQQEMLDRVSSAVTPAATDFLQARERLRQARASILEDDPQGLTADEQRVLESLRSARQDAEERSSGRPPRSINYTSSSMFSNRTRSPSRHTVASRPFSDVLINPNDPYAAFPELSRTSQRNQGLEMDRLAGDNTLPPLHSIQEYLRLRDRRREASSSSASNDQTRSEHRRRTILPPPHATRVIIPSNSTPEPEEQNPWRTISNAMNLARGPFFESSRLNETADAATTALSSRREQEPSNRADQLRRIAAQRDRLRSIRQEFGNAGGGGSSRDSISDSLNTIRALRTMTAIPGNEYDDVLVSRRSGGDVNFGVRTAGLAMSHDGRTLWAACEDGIFEIQINVKGRMAFPAIEMR